MSGIHVLSGSIVGAFAVALVPSASAFTDVPVTHPYYTSIIYVHQARFANGYDDGTYKPERHINRAEFLKIVFAAKMNADPATGRAWGLEQCFKYESKEAFQRKYGTMTDVDFDAWYADYLCLGVRSGYLKGYPDRTFRPDAHINFAEAAKILVTLFEREYTETGVWYEGYVNAMQRLNAVPPSIVSNDALITRGEMAEMLFRIRHGGTEATRAFSNLFTTGPDLKTYEDKKAGLEFYYPVRMTVGAPKSFYVKEGERGLQIDDAGNGGIIQIVLRPFNSGTNRFEEICVKPDGYDCLEYGKLDLLKQKEEVDRNGFTGFYRHPVIMTDSYSPSGGNLSRSYLLFTEAYRVSIHANFDLWRVYERLPDVPPGASLTELVKKDLGGDTSISPIDRLMEIHPDADDLSAFYQDADALVFTLRKNLSDRLKIQALKNPR